MSRPFLAAFVTAGIAGSLLSFDPALARTAHGDGGDPVIARVNGEAIHKSDAEAELAQMLPPGKRPSLSDPEVFDKVRTDLIARKLAYQEAVHEGLQNSAEVKKAEAMANQTILTNAWFQKVAAPAVTDEKLHAAYQQAIKNHPAEEELHLRQIEVKTEDEAKDVIKQLDGGADFQKLAKEKSVNKGNADDGGDMGWVTKSAISHIDPTFADAAFGLQANSYTKTAVKVGADYHIIQALDRRPAKLPEFDEAKSQLVPQLQRLAINQKLAELAHGHVEAFNVDGSPATNPAASPGPGAAPAQPKADQQAPAANAPTPGPGAGSAPLQLPQTQPQQ